MKTFLKFAGIPIGLFVVLFALPRLFAMLINVHSDFGIAAVIVIVAMIVGGIGVYVTKMIEKVNENEV